MFFKLCVTSCFLGVPCGRLRARKPLGCDFANRDLQCDLRLRKLRYGLSTPTEVGLLRDRGFIVNCRIGCF